MTVCISVSVLILFHSIDNSVFTHVNTVERSRKTMSVRVSATVERLLSNCFARMVYTTYKKQRILHFYSKGYKAPTVQKLLKISCAVALAKFIKVFECTGSICRQPGSGRPLRVNRGVKDFVEQQMVWGGLNWK